MFCVRNRRSFRESLLMFLVVSAFPILSYAIKSEAFTNALSREVYADCKNHMVKIRINSLLALVLVSNDPTFKNLKITTENEWRGFQLNPTWHNISELIRILPTQEPYTEYIDFPESPQRASSFDIERTVMLNGETFKFFPDGLGILQYGKKTLDINGSQYFWDKKLFDLPKVENAYKTTFFENGKINIQFTPLEISTLGGVSLWGSISLFSFLVRSAKRSKK